MLEASLLDLSPESSGSEESTEDIEEEKTAEERQDLGFFRPGDDGSEATVEDSEATSNNPSLLSPSRASGMGKTLTSRATDKDMNQSGTLPGVDDDFTYHNDTQDAVRTPKEKKKYSTHKTSNHSSSLNQSYEHLDQNEEVKQKVKEPMETYSLPTGNSLSSRCLLDKNKFQTGRMEESKHLKLSDSSRPLS